MCVLHAPTTSHHPSCLLCVQDFKVHYVRVLACAPDAKAYIMNFSISINTIGDSRQDDNYLDRLVQLKQVISAVLWVTVLDCESPT